MQRKGMRREHIRSLRFRCRREGERRTEKDREREREREKDRVYVREW